MTNDVKPCVMIKPSAFRFPLSAFRFRAKRRGLAPLEFVLWLPILMMVAGLIVNVGTSQTWRIRGEIVARDAV